MTTMTAVQVRAQTALMKQVPDPEVPERPRPPRSYRPPADVERPVKGPFRLVNGMVWARR
jgi:hypothetical protein